MLDLTDLFKNGNITENIHLGMNSKKYEILQKDITNYKEFHGDNKEFLVYFGVGTQLTFYNDKLWLLAFEFYDKRAKFILNDVKISRKTSFEKFIRILDRLNLNYIKDEKEKDEIKIVVNNIEVYFELPKRTLIVIHKSDDQFLY